MNTWIRRLMGTAERGTETTDRPASSAPATADAITSARITLARERVPKIAQCFDGVDESESRELMVRLLSDTATERDQLAAAEIFSTRMPRSPHVPLELDAVAPYVIADDRWKTAVRARIKRAEAGPNLQALLVIFGELCRYYDAYVIGLRRPTRCLGRFPLSAYGAIGRIETVLARRRFETIEELAGAARLGISLRPQAPLPSGFEIDPTALLWILNGPVPAAARKFDHAVVDGGPGPGPDSEG